MNSTAVKTPENKLWSVITASSVGTLIEWYDFYIFGALATIISQQFFPNEDPRLAFILTLATFAVGFVFRPFGALVFGSLGDIIGRKYTFLLTLVLMGGSTFAIGFIPGYDTIGYWAPGIVIFLRIVQGLALGGEYGGAATYVAEHAPAGKRGFYTSFIQTTATLGLFVSIGVILAVSQSMSSDDFSEWGWRIPFLLSAFLVGISIYIRLRMQESPLFAKIKLEGKLSRNPIKESFTKKENLRLVLIALFGAAAGQGVVWYTGQFYAMSFLQKTCSIEFVQSYYLIATALVIGTPLFVFFGWWSDRVGRKYIMMAGMLLAVFLYRPIYRTMYNLADTSQMTERIESRSISKSTSFREDGAVVTTTRILHIFDNENTLTDIAKETATTEGLLPVEKSKEIKLANAGYWAMVGLVLIQVVLVTMVYGPIAAFLVELFPTRIRYTSMSLPYHIGNGIFGGLTPVTATYLASRSTDPIVGLWYPIGVAALCFIVGMIFLKNKSEANVNE